MTFDHESAVVFARVLRAAADMLEADFSPTIASGKKFQRWAEGEHVRIDGLLDDCDISIRSKNMCDALGCETLGQLRTFTKSQLLEVPNFGLKSMREIESLLKSYGLRLA